MNLHFTHSVQSLHIVTVIQVQASIAVKTEDCILHLVVYHLTFGYVLQFGPCSMNGLWIKIEQCLM